MATRTVSVRLQAEIGQYVSSMAKAAVATKGVGDAATGTGARVGRGFDIASRGALLLGAGVAGALVGIVTKSMDFEKAMSGVQAATQETGAALGDLREAAMKAGAATQYSATEAAQAITEMGKAGVSTADILDGGLAGALSLAAAGQLDVAQAAGIASVAMTQFKLSGDQLPHVADLLAAGAGKAMGSVDDLGMALNQAGLVASSTGLSIEETTGTLAAFASAGLIGSDAGTSFRSMLQHLQNPSKESADAMANLGINMYNANGNFVGMASLAGQLQTRMAGLTQAERDKAMATIFGSDAVRAANVLYTQGAKGIQDWTSKVNDAGYAQRQAAQLTDNLAGDLERLGGAFDTFLISAGSGAQGPLRMLVQGLTGVVDGLSWLLNVVQSVPAPIMAVVAALTAVHLLNGPVTTGMKMVGFTFDVVGASARASAATVLGSGSVMASAGIIAKAGWAGFMTMMGGPVGLAIAGVTLAFSLLSSATDDNSESTDDAARSQSGLAQALMASKGAIDANVRAAAAKEAQDRGVLDVAKQLHIPLSSITDAILGQGNSLNETMAKMQAYINTQQGFNQDTTAGGLATIEAKNALLELSGQTEGNIADAQQLGEATARSGEAMGGASIMASDLTTELENTQTAANNAKTSTDLLKLSLDILTGAHVDMATAEAAFYEAVAQADGALNDLGGSTLNAAGNLDVQSEAGRKAQEVLFGVRDSGDQLIATMIQQGATADQANAKDAELREGFIKTAEQMGISRGAAENLANQIYGIPAERQAKITADTVQASSAVANLAAQIAGLHDRVINIVARATMPDLPGEGSTSQRMGTYASGGTPRAGEVALVGEEGPEIVRFGSAATVYTAAETRSMLSGREVSGASHAAPSVHVAAPSLDGMRISGTVAFDPSGMLRFVDARIDSGMGELADTVHYTGG